MKKSTESKLQMWISHIEGAKGYSGGLDSYCREKQISRPAFYYWKAKLAKESKPMKLPSFIPVEVTRGMERATGLLPDPRWLAEFIHHLQAGGAQ
jgi:hypothetical protein